MSVIRRRVCCVLAALLSVGCFAGCGGYYSGYEFLPRPARVETLHVDGQATGVVALVSVMGIRRADPSNHEPAAVEVRMRLTNHGSETAECRSGSVALFSADLRAFDPPRLAPAHTIRIAPGESAELTARFPFTDRTPLEEVDLASLHLSWQITVDDRHLAQSTTLTRSYRRDQDLHYAHRRYGFYPIGYHHHFSRCD